MIVSKTKLSATTKKKKLTKLTNKKKDSNNIYKTASI
jgi:hypothetical protein